VQNAGKGLLGCGGLLLLLSGLAVLFFGFHVFLDPRGNISDDEALPGLIGGVLCGFVNVALIVAGVVMMRSRASTEGAVPSVGGTAPSGGIPYHYATGCGSLIFLCLTCLPLGLAYDFYDSMEYAHSRAIEVGFEESYGRETYGLDSYYYERREQEHQQNMGLSCCCASFVFLLGLGGIGGTVVLARRRAAAT
jgi:hypothetical protein